MLMDFPIFFECRPILWVRERRMMKRGWKMISTWKRKRPKAADTRQQ